MDIDWAKPDNFSTGRALYQRRERVIEDILQRDDITQIHTAVFQL